MFQAWTGKMKIYKNTWAQSTRSPITCPAGIEKIEKIEYDEDRPEDGRGRLKPGDKWVYYQISRTETEWIDGRRYENTYWLAQILRPKKGGAPCYVWKRGKDEALKYQHQNVARKAAEEARGRVRQVQRKYLAKEMDT